MSETHRIFNLDNVVNYLKIRGLEIKIRECPAGLLVKTRIAHTVKCIAVTIPVPLPEDHYVDPIRLAREIEKTVKVKLAELVKTGRIDGKGVKIQ